MVSQEKQKKKGKKKKTCADKKAIEKKTLNVVVKVELDGIKLLTP